MFKNLSIKQKLIVIIWGTTLISTVLAVSLIVLVDIGDHKKTTLSNGTLQAKLVAEYVKVSLEFDDPVWAEHVVSKLSEIPDILEGSVYNNDGNVFATFLTPKELSVVRDLDNIATGDKGKGFLYVKEPVVNDGNSIGFVLLRISTEPIKKRIQNFIFTVLAIVAGVFVLAYLLASILQKLISKPIVELSHAAKSISHNSQYQFKLIHSGTDELGELYDEFGSMIKTLKIRDEELQTARAYLNSVIDSMPSILIGINKDGAITSMNNMAEESARVDRKNAIGKPLAKIFQQYEKYVAEIIKTIEDRKSISKLKIDDTISERTRLVDLTAYPLISDGLEGAVIRIDDVTSRVRMEKIMIQTEKMMSIGGMAAGMAHEINNPLGIIAQGAQNILQKVNPNIKANERVAAECDVSMDNLDHYFKKRHIYTFITDIREATERAASIVTNILNFSRKSDSNKSPVQIADLLDKTIALVATDFDLKKKYDFKSIELNRNYAINTPDAEVCATEIEQVFINLLKNGAQAMAEVPNRKHRFNLYVSYDSLNVVVIISDNGPGMPEEVIDRIFEPFYTTKGVGVGTGLGLSVSYMIIQNNHNGTMHVESEEGKGTKFTITLPIKALQ